MSENSKFGKYKGRYFLLLLLGGGYSVCRLFLPRIYFSETYLSLVNGWRFETEASRTLGPPRETCSWRSPVSERIKKVMAGRVLGPRHDLLRLYVHTVGGPCHTEKVESTVYITRVSPAQCRGGLRLGRSSLGTGV